MPKPKKTTKLTDLDQIAEGMALRVRNITAQVLVFSSQNGQPAIVLNPQHETVAPSDWAKNRSLRKAYAAKQIQVEVVEPTYEPRSVPSVDKAPDEARPVQGYDRVYAQNVVLCTNVEEALTWVNVTVRELDTQTVDVRFMKQRFLPILNYVKWAEPQLQNRKEVLTAARKRIDEIRAM